MTIAISTTLLYPGPSFLTWLDYHLRRVEVIFIFMDDPCERPIFEAACRGRRVALFDGSQDSLAMTPSSRIMTRQRLNNDLAIAFGMAHKIDWLLHIDSDEIFYEEADRSWEHQQDVGHVTFTNHEVVPAAYEVADRFKELTLFKMNGRMNFMGYINGKSAVRLTPGVTSLGPHNFIKYQGAHRSVTSPMILHYPTPTFDAWVTKYKMYGVFSDFWWDDPRQPNRVTFMLESRDHLQAALASGNWERARAFYNAMIPDAPMRQRLLDSGSLRVFTPLSAPPAQVVQRTPELRGPV